MDTTGLGYFPKAGFCYRNVEKSGSANRDLVIKMTKRFSQCRCQHLRMWTKHKDFFPSVSTRPEHCGMTRHVSTCLQWVTGQKEE